MIYRSNLTAPDVQRHFKHAHCRPMRHSFGHDVLSDFADYPADHPVFGLYKHCGFWTHDEAAILYNVAKEFQGEWLDIGAHTGWTAAHLRAAGCGVFGLEPMMGQREFAERLRENVGVLDYVSFRAQRSDQYFEVIGEQRYRGVVIDGDHGYPVPLNDAKGAASCLYERGAVLFHDAIGKPVQDGVVWLVNQGFKCKVYSTPHVVALCWRGDFEPPHHVADPMVKQGIKPYLGAIAPYAN